MLDRYKVRSRSRQEIEALADRARSLANLGNRLSFNVVSFIEDFLVPQLKGGLTINLFTRVCRSEKPAFVEFEPNVLHVDESVWMLARYHNHAYSRFVLAHEIGHLVLHRRQKMAFYGQIKDVKPTFFEDHECSEWQANTFALYFLIPTQVVSLFQSVDPLVEFCLVPEHLAEEAVAEFRDQKRRKGRHYEGEACPECANFTLVRNGTCLRCDTCGSTTGCS